MSDLISRCELFNRLAPVQTLADAYAVIQGMPTVEPEVIRCKDCRWHRDQSMAPMWLPCSVINTTNNYFCADAERKYDE